MPGLQVETSELRLHECKMWSRRLETSGVYLRSGVNP